MLLDSEPRKARDEPKLDIPSKENAAPLPAPPPAPAPVVEEAKKPAPKVAVVVPKVEPKAEPKAEPKSEPRKEGFVVQVGAFADEARLQEIKGKLALSNIVTYTEAAGSLKRLRVGPFTTKEAAEKSAVEVRKVVPEAKVIANN